MGVACILRRLSVRISPNHYNKYKAQYRHTFTDKFTKHDRPRFEWSTKRSKHTKQRTKVDLIDTFTHSGRGVVYWQKHSHFICTLCMRTKGTPNHRRLDCIHLKQ